VLFIEKKMTCPVTECCIHVKKCCATKGCKTKKTACKRISKCHGTYSKCGAFKIHKSKFFRCKHRKCCKFFRSCVGTKCQNKRLVCREHQTCKAICHKKLLRKCQKWRKIKSNKFTCSVRKCFKLERKCCGKSCKNRKISTKKHSRCHKQFGKCGKWMTKKNQTFNL